MKNLLSIIVVALLFIGAQDALAETINACVNKNNGNTRILAPDSNSEECRNSENPVSWSGESSKKVFVTSQGFGGDLVSEADFFADCAELEDGIEAADCICQEIAEAAENPLYGNYKAWISDSDQFKSPFIRFTKSTFPYVRIDGMKVADNWADLTTCNEGPGGDECLENPINIDENGEPYGNAPAWTNTEKDGSQINNDPSLTCGDWTTNFPIPNGFPRIGAPNVKDIGWTNNGAGVNCPPQFKHLYCFQQ